jgi:hypothetical protein
MTTEAFLLNLAFLIGGSILTIVGTIVVNEYLFLIVHGLFLFSKEYKSTADFNEKAKKYITNLTVGFGGMLLGMGVIFISINHMLGG